MAAQLEIFPPGRGIDDFPYQTNFGRIKGKGRAESRGALDKEGRLGYCQLDREEPGE